MKRFVAFLSFLFGLFGAVVAGGQEALPQAIPGWGAPLLWSAGQGEATDAAKGSSRPKKEGLQALPTAPLPLIGITPCRIADTRDGGRPAGLLLPAFFRLLALPRTHLGRSIPNSRLSSRES